MTEFYTYYLARELESIAIAEEEFAKVFQSANIDVYPHQVEGANFVMQSLHLGGVVLCDESGMGKSHEAMICLSQLWLEGKKKLLITTPNNDLLEQWRELLEKYYTLPYEVISSSVEWNAKRSIDNKNAFNQDAIILTTNDFLIEHYADAKKVVWETMVFEEANCLSSVYQENKQNAKRLKELSKNTFKILLTGTPIEKNIMDLYGLIYFIDENVLPDEQTFLHRYLRKPENYGELATKVSKYCYRTLKSEAKQYALVPKRNHIAIEYSLDENELALYNALNEYINQDSKIAFPEMNNYDLSLRLLGLCGSSSKAIASTLEGIIARLSGNSGADAEVVELKNMLKQAQNIERDSKAKILLKVLPKLFAILKSKQANKKAVIFTESNETQKYLFELLSPKYKTTVYNGKALYSAIKEFKDTGEILISTDYGAKGFNLEEASLVINYDLIYNSLKMEQRINRVHRLNQKNDVIVVSFVAKDNLAEVRKIELMSKRHLVSSGVMGLSDSVIGGFTDNIESGLAELESKLSTKQQVQVDYDKTLQSNQDENIEIVENAECALFTTFTKELAQKVTISPKYIDDKVNQINVDLWEVAKYYFNNYNTHNSDCHYEIDEENQTITATNYTKLPRLFYYFNNSGSKAYTSQKQYGMAKDFKPRYGRITLTSIIGQGILQEIECGDSGKMTIGEVQMTNDKGQMTINKDRLPYIIALYSMKIDGQLNSYPYFVGVDANGQALREEMCKEVLQYEGVKVNETTRKSVHWLRTSCKPHPIDKDLDKTKFKNSHLISQEASNTIGQQIQLETKRKLHEIEYGLKELSNEIENIAIDIESAKTDRVKVLTLTRLLKEKQHALRQKEDNIYFDKMRLEQELEQQMLVGSGGVDDSNIQAIRQFVVEVK